MGGHLFGSLVHLFGLAVNLSPFVDDGEWSCVSPLVELVGDFVVTTHCRVQVHALSESISASSCARKSSGNLSMICTPARSASDSSVILVLPKEHRRHGTPRFRRGDSLAGHTRTPSD